LCTLFIRMLYAASVVADVEPDKLTPQFDVSNTVKAALYISFAGPGCSGGRFYSGRPGGNSRANPGTPKAGEFAEGAASRGLIARTRKLGEANLYSVRAVGPGTASAWQLQLTEPKVEHEDLWLHLTLSADQPLFTWTTAPTDRLPAVSRP
jgi:hypothetical protein